MSVNKDAINNQIQERAGFAQVPNEIWEAEGVSIYAKTIWAYLLSRHPNWNGSIANLSRNLGFSVSTAKRAVDELELKGMITTKKTNTGTDFDVRPSTEWLLEKGQSAPVEPARPIPKSQPALQREGAPNTITSLSNTQHFAASCESSEVSEEILFKEKELEADLTSFLRS